MAKTPETVIGKWANPLGLNLIEIRTPGDPLVWRLSQISPAWFSGTVDPSSTTDFLDTDLYINTTDGSIWELQSGAWINITSGGTGTGFNGVNVQTVDYTLLSSDNGKLVVHNSGSPHTFTLPDPPSSDTWVAFIQNIGVGDLTVSPDTLDIDGSASSLTLTQNQGVVIFTDGTNYFTERGMGSSGTGSYSEEFTNVITYTVLGSNHNLDTANLVVVIYDPVIGTRSLVIPNSVDIDSTTFDVTVTFGSTQSGIIILIAGGGGGGGGGSAGVSTLNGLDGDIILAAGTGISLTPIGHTITIANTSSATIAGTIGSGEVGFGASTNVLTSDPDFAWDNSSNIFSIKGTLTFSGSSSGSASLGVATVAGTPRKLLLPTTNGTANQILKGDGGNPQQLSWASAVLTPVVIGAGLVPFGGSVSGTLDSDSSFIYTDSLNFLSVTASTGARTTGGGSPYYPVIFGYLSASLETTSDPQYSIYGRLAPNNSGGITNSAENAAVAGIVSGLGNRPCLGSYCGFVSQVGYSAFGTVTTMKGYSALSNSTTGVTSNNFGFYSYSQAGVGSALNAAFYSASQGSGTNDYAFYSAGGKNFFGGTQGTAFGGPVTLNGSSSGSAIIGVAASAGSPNRMNLPTSSGSAGQVLTTDGGSPQQLTWATVTGTGTVTSVGMIGDGVIFNSSVTNSPVTGAGDLTPVLLTQTANKILAGPTSGGAAAPTFRSLVVADIPVLTIDGTTVSNGVTGSGAVVLAAAPALTGNPTATTQLSSDNSTRLATTAFVQSVALGAGAVTSVFGRAGVVTAATNDYSFSQISGSVAAAQLPNPTVSTLGGIEAIVAVSNKWINAINTSGVPQLVQPDFTNLSGSIAIGQTVLTTLGDILYADASPALARLAGNTTATKKYLSQTGNGSISAVPAWAQIAAGDTSNGTTGSGAIVLAAGSPAFSGTPTSTTPATTDNSTKIATTAYVQAQKFFSTFVSTTSVSITGATHGLGTADLIIQVYDSATGTRNVIIPNTISVDSTTFNVTITFVSAQSGRVVLHA